MMLISQKHLAALSPYADFSFALATAPPPPLSSTANTLPVQSTPAVVYYDLAQLPSSDSTIREVSSTRKLHFTSFLIEPAHAVAVAPLSVTREDLVLVLGLILRRYTDAADLATEVVQTMAEPLGKPDAAWCLDIHRSVIDVQKRRLEMARTYNRELMRLGDLERTGHVPRAWKTFSHPSNKRTPIGGGRRRRSKGSMKAPSPSPTVNEVGEEEADNGEAGPSLSLSPLMRPSALSKLDVAPDETDWTGSIQCGGIHFVSEWVLRVTCLIKADGFPGRQEADDITALGTARAELTKLQHGMAHIKDRPTSPPPPPYTKPVGVGSPEPPPRSFEPNGRSRSLSLSLARYRSSPTPRTPVEKLNARDKAAKAAMDPKDADNAARVGVGQYLRRLFIGA